MSDSTFRQCQPALAKPTKAPPGKKKDRFTIPLPPNQSPAANFIKDLIRAVIIAYCIFHFALRTYLPNFYSLSPASSYILCSPPGAPQIYTVDNDDSRVECMAVSGNFIVDTGSHSMSHEAGHLSDLAHRWIS